MDKKTIAFFKDRFPKAFSTVVQSPFLSRIALELDRGNYLYCMMAGKPYFGTIALAGQTWDQRRSWMKRLADQEIRRKKEGSFDLLEIGSWAGDSAVLWADAIKNSGRKGTVVCIDPWEPYLKTRDQEKVNAALILMDKLLRKRAVFQLFLHNVKSSGHAETIIPVKGASSRILPLLQEECFDFVFIDGDHSYSGVSRDLSLAARVVRDGGILCGDDLDLSLDMIDRDFAWKNREVNMIIDPKTGRACHPGVVLAVSEFFKADISCYDGFWVMRKSGHGWQPVPMDQEKVKICV